MTDKVDVACAVIVRNGMIMAANRGDSVSNAGVWEFPGGKPANGETFEACVVRRVMEEMNLNIRVLDAMPSYDVVSGGREFTMHPFFAEIVGGRPILMGHSRAEWFMPIQLMRLAWPATDIPIIEEVVNRIMKQGRIV